MRKELEGKLEVLQIEAKEARKTKSIKLLIAFTLVVLCISIPFFYPLFGILLVFAIFGGIYIFDGISTLNQPLKTEFRAFEKIISAIKILEKSKEDVTYREASRCLKKAYKLLKSVELNDLGWYSWSNEVYEKFLNNLNLIIIPAINERIIKIDDLEEIAIALYSVDPILLNTVNARIESESTYKKSIVRVSESKPFTRQLKESTIGKIFFSVAFGYFFILIICVLYVALTQQDFMTFARERPDIIITGGLLASGITSVTIWKIR